MIPTSSGPTSVTNTSSITIPSSSGPNNNLPDQSQTGTDGTRVRVIVSAVVVTVLVLTLIATIAVIAIVLRLKRGSKQGISNPAYGKRQ